MLTRWLRFLWGFGLLALLGGLWAGWPQHLGWVAGVAVAVALGFALVMAAEFAALYAVSRAGLSAGPGLAAPPPLPSFSQLVRAWWGEVCASLRLFGWWQPFRAHAWPDFLPATPTGRRGVVLVHGYVCNRAVWLPWFPRLRALGHAHVAVNLEPVWGSIDAYAPLIDDAVQRVTQATGLPPVLICHSMGGLAARAWLRSVAGAGVVHGALPGALPVQRVAQVITVGTPHHGTWLARWNRLSSSENAAQMRPASPWLRQLAQDEQAAAGDGQAYSGFTCFYGHCDNIVFPVDTATLPGARHRHVPGLAHVAMALDAQLIAECLASLDESALPRG